MKESFGPGLTSILIYGLTWTGLREQIIQEFEEVHVPYCLSI